MTHLRHLLLCLLPVLLAIAANAPAAPIMFGGDEPCGTIAQFGDKLVGQGSIDNLGNSDADNMVSQTFVAPPGHVLWVHRISIDGEPCSWRSQTPERVTLSHSVASGDSFFYRFSSPSPPAVPGIGTLEAMSDLHGPFNTLQVWLPVVPVAEPPTQAVSCVSVERTGAGHVRLAFANGDGNAVLAVANQPDFTPWPGRTYEGAGYGFAAARPHDTGTVTVAGLAAGTAHTFRLFAANTAPGRQPYYLSAPSAAAASTLPLGNRGSVRPIFDAMRVVSNRVGLAVLELDTRLWQQIEVSTNGTNWTVEAVLNTTTSAVPPAAVATNWAGRADAPSRWYRVRAEW